MASMFRMGELAFSECDYAAFALPSVVARTAFAMACDARALQRQSSDSGRPWNTLSRCLPHPEYVTLLH